MTNKSYAVFAEYAKESRPMLTGWNTRVFNTLETDSGSDIHLGEDGIITLEPGTYHIVASSLVTYLPDDFSGEDGGDDSSTSEKPEGWPHPGYCELRELVPGVERAWITTGTMCNASYLGASLVDTYYTAAARCQIFVTHQIGGEDWHVEDVYLQFHGGNASTNHVMARISIEKL